MRDIELLQNILRKKSTTYLRTIFDEYCKEKELPKWTHKKPQNKWYFSQYDCKRRLRTICRLCDGKNELNITLRKKAGYYLIIEYNRHRIFECEPKVIVLDEDILKNVLIKYKDLFDRIFDNPELLH